MIAATRRQLRRMHSRCRRFAESHARPLANCHFRGERDSFGEQSCHACRRTGRRREATFSADHVNVAAFTCTHEWERTAEDVHNATLVPSVDRTNPGPKWTICALRATEASAVGGAGLCPRCVVENCFRLRIPINLLPRPIGARRHHTGHRVRKSVVHGGVWLFSAAQAIQPISHMRGVLIPNSHRRKCLVVGQQDVLDGTLAVNISIIFVISLLFHYLPARAALAAVVDHRGFLSHDSRKSRRVITEACRVADQETLRIGE